MERVLTEAESAVIEAALELAFILEASRHGPIKGETLTRALSSLRVICEELQNETAPDTWSSL